MDSTLEALEATVAERRIKAGEGSYTRYLFDSGLDKILKKVGEECTETVIAAKNGDREPLCGEIADLTYHLMVMMNECGVSVADVKAVLDERAKKSSNLKKMKKTDKNT